MPKDTTPITTLAQAQALVRDFAVRNGWPDRPNVDKFDHLHEELIEMSQHLRYKTEAERLAVIRERHDVFVDGIGDLLFALCRLANQLDVDIAQAFNRSSQDILAKYHEPVETNHPKSTGEHHDQA